VTAAEPAPGPRRLGTILRAAGWTVLYLAVGITLMVVFSNILVGLLIGFEPGARARFARATPAALAIQTVSGLVAFGLLTWSLGVKGLRLTARDLRWRPTTVAGRGFLLGLMLGGLASGVAILLSLVVSGARFAPDQGSGAEYLGQLGRTVLLLAPAALLEEIMFRGVGQVILARAVGRVPAVVALSVAFALAHVLNPNTTALGLVNIGLAGVFLGFVFYAPGGIWTAWGAHLGWNAALAALDAPVSGLPFRIPLIDYLPGGPSWLDGGNFGPEGGLLASAALAGATFMAWQWARKETA
jgi:membrane protease YdiL (CAAX protease family)